VEIVSHQYELFILRLLPMIEQDKYDLSLLNG
jgi:hypothetical protein